MLGIFGLMLAGLWVVVGIVRENVKREQAAEEIMIAVKNIRSFYEGQALVQVPGTAGTQANFANLTDYLVRQNVLPNDAIRLPVPVTPTPLALADNPWGPVVGGGGSFAVDDNNSNDGDLNVTAPLLATTDGQSFRIRLSGLNQGACMAVAPRIASASGPPGLMGVVINGTLMTVANNGLPLTVAVAHTNCSAYPATSTVDFVYRLRQQTP